MASACRGLSIQALVLALVLTGCRDSDIQFEGIVPGQIPVASSVFAARDFGACAIEVFAVDPAFAAALKEHGLSALESASAARDWPGVGEDGANLRFEPWRQGATRGAVEPGSFRQGAVYDVYACLDGRPDIQSAYDALMIRDGESFFTFSTEESGILGDDFLFLMAFGSQTLLIAAPH